MASLNKVQLIGRLTDDPEPPRTLSNSGSTVVKFRFAVGRGKKNQQTGQWENDPNPLYLDCEVYTRADTRRDLCAVISNYARKGSQLYLEGRLQLDTWDDKTTGQKRSKHKLVADTVELLDKAPGSGGGDYQGGHDDTGMDAPPARSYGPPPKGAVSRGPAPRPAPPPADDGGHGDPDDIPF